MVRPRTFDEAQVSWAVRDEFWDKGYAGTSMSDLLRVSGLGKGSLYGAFGDKRALFLRVLREYGESKMQTLREQSETARSGMEVLRSFVFEPAADPTGAASRRGCLLANSSAELSSIDPDVAAQAQHVYTSMLAVLAPAIERAQQEGEVAAHLDPESTATAVLVAQLGIVTLGRTGMSPTFLAEAANAALLRIFPPTVPE
jgi:TetR/AcrR family transcriptional repressor of nem operon